MTEGTRSDLLDGREVADKRRAWMPGRAAKAALQRADGEIDTLSEYSVSEG
jgi:hypothetical protein